MRYRSTRGSMKNSLNSTQAVIQGLAPDGGLFVPVKFPQMDLPLSQLSQLTYQEIAGKVLQAFFDDVENQTLQEIIDTAYGQQWDDPAIAPLSEKYGNNYYLELFHGPTLAFKDIALQVLPPVMTKSASIEKIKGEIVILTATSGDTGIAAMRGFSDQAGTRVIVFYPHGGVSPVQLKQMLSQNGQNLSAIAIDGNFDDAQSQVKQIFNDQDFNRQLAANNYQFSSANSMNIGRLVPQIVYYFNAYGQLVRRGDIKTGEAVNFAVPTGNFGDILAGHYAKKLGLPIHKLICASDENKVLTDFFTTGKYDRRRDFYLTNSPAMDILVSSNLERLLFDLYDGDEEAIRRLMEALDQEGYYSVDPNIMKKMGQEFGAGFADQGQVRDEIKRIYDRYHYLIDPHTAVASFVTRQYQAATNDSTKTVIVSTASPYKFPETVLQSLNAKKPDHGGLSAIRDLQELLGQKLSPNVEALFAPALRQEKVIQADGMEKEISRILNLK